MCAIGAHREHPAVAHDDDAVGYGEHLRQAVRHEDRGHASRLQGAHPIEQPLGLAPGQRGGRLVEDQKPDPLRERSCDQDQLLGGKVERAHLGFRLDIDTESGEDVCGLGIAYARSTKPQRDGSAPKIHVLRHGQVRADVDFLRYQGDAGALGLGDVFRRIGRAGDSDGAFIAARGVNARQNLDQRRLAGAVLAEQRHDLTLRQIEIHTVDGSDAGKSLADPPGGEDEVIVRARHPSGRPRQMDQQVGFLSGTFL